MSEGSILDVDYINFEEGMLNRRKKPNVFPLLSINECLNHFGITLSDIDIIATDYSEEKSWHDPCPKNRKLVGDYIKQHLDFRPEKIFICNSHHLAHAYSAVWPSGFPETSVVVIDGAGSNYETSSVYTFNRNEGFKITSQMFGTGIGLLYTLITKELGFKTGEEGKTMGLAPFGREVSESIFAQSLRGDDIGLFTDYSKLVNRFPSHSLRFELQQKAEHESIFSDYFARVAYDLQAELERSVLRTMSQVRTDHGLSSLCYSGGVALNCVANAKIHANGIFKQVFIQPNAGDAGIPFGLAILGMEHLLLSKNICTNRFWELGPEKFTPYAPVKFSTDELCSFLSSHEIQAEPRDNLHIVKTLRDGGVVAHFEGGWEFGPRALGHRSFLASPASRSMIDVLNIKIKHREAYRPFAPIVLEEFFHDYFHGSDNKHPFMLTALDCKDQAISEAPAIVHIDNTARVQTIGPCSDEIRRILELWKSETGSAILINTSFNDNNEPIVLDPFDALSCFLRTNADLLVVENLMFSRPGEALCEKLLEALERRTDESLVRKYKEVFQSSLFIKKSNPIESLKSFTRRKLAASIYHRYIRPIERLEELFANNLFSGFDCLILDERHKQILSFYANVYGRKLDSFFLFPDEPKKFIDNLENFGERNLVFLYNSSIIQRFQDGRVPTTSSEFCFFYAPNDAMIRLELLDSPVDLFSKISDTYECNRYKTLPEFYLEVLFPAFSKEYLGIGQLSDANRVRLTSS